MKFDGQAIKLLELEEGLWELKFDLQYESVNTLGQRTLSDFEQILSLLESTAGINGLLLTSGKPAFIVGADISEFLPLFSQGPEETEKLIKYVCVLFNRLEDLPFPSVVAINGYALGGGLELCLSCDYRIMSTDAKIGLPETKLGILPGWGGTVRLPRLVGVDTAIEWIAGGTENKGDVAFKAGVVDAAVSPEKLRDVSLATLKRLVNGELDYKARREQKKAPLQHNDIESLMAFESAKAFVAGKAGKHYPAPVKSIKTMQEAAKMSRDEALLVENAAFVKLAGTPVARSLVGLFLNDQLVSKTAKKLSASVESPVKRAAVLGAGIMGGGIAYQSAYKNVPVKMKDIAQAGIDMGLNEAKTLLAKQVERGRIDTGTMADVLNRIEPTLSYDGFEQTDLVVEAVVENEKVKKAVLAETETKVHSGTVLCSNTSTISITRLAEGLQRPENFCGMHFFNPVHRMPLVEVIRGEHSSDAAIAKTVAYATAIGKKAIVVNDCPGFLVNRVLFPYFAGFTMLVRDGGDIATIDKVMERWGLPMGPAYLLDVVGIDTAEHAGKVMAEGFPSRLKSEFKTCIEILFEAGRYGQKNDKGFYDHGVDKKGKPTKVLSHEALELFKGHVQEPKEFSEEEIIARMMVPMATEMSRCLEEGVVASVAEADMALIYGVGFPPFRGGIFRWLDEIGMQAFQEMADAHKALGKLYELTESMQEIAQSGSTYYQSADQSAAK